MSNVHISHAPLDLVTGPKGDKPWLTIAVDKNTGTLIGLYVEPGPPTDKTVDDCLAKLKAGKLRVPKPSKPLR